MPTRTSPPSTQSGKLESRERALLLLAIAFAAAACFGPSAFSLHKLGLKLAVQLHAAAAAF